MLTTKGSVNKTWLVVLLIIVVLILVYVGIVVYQNSQADMANPTPSKKCIWPTKLDKAANTCKIF